MHKQSIAEYYDTIYTVCVFTIRDTRTMIQCS